MTNKIKTIKFCNNNHNVYIKTWDNLLKQEYYAQVVCKDCRKKTKVYKDIRSIEAINKAITAWNISI